MSIAAYSDLYTDDALRASRASSYRAAMDRSRTALEQLFGTGLEATQRALAARRARIAVLDRIVIPVDSVFGRREAGRSWSPRRRRHGGLRAMAARFVDRAR